MVRGLGKNLKDIKWHRVNPPLQEGDLMLLKDFPFTLPSKFIELLKISDGGFVDYSFDYFDLYFKEVLEGSIGEIYGIGTKSTKMKNRNYDRHEAYHNFNYKEEEFFTSYHDIIHLYRNPPEFFPENLVAFGENGGGDLMCFDYRSNPYINNPPIVYWIMGREIGKDISFLANNFTKFLAMLKEPEPYLGSEV